MSNKTLEIVEFATKPGVAERELVAAVDGLLPDLQAAGGFVSQQLHKAEGGGWVILYRWDTLADAKSSMGKLADRPPLQRLLGLVADPTAIRFTYAAEM